MLKVNIMQADTKKFSFIREVSLYDIIQEYVAEDSCLKTLQSNEDFIEMIDVRYALNNKGDLLVRVREKPQSDHLNGGHFIHDELLETTYYFYIKHELDARGK